MVGEKRIKVSPEGESESISCLNDNALRVERFRGFEGNYPKQVRSYVNGRWREVGGAGVAQRNGSRTQRHDCTNRAGL